MMFRYHLLAVFFFVTVHAMQRGIIIEQPHDPKLTCMRKALTSSIPIFEPKKALDIDPTLEIIPIAMKFRPGVCYNYAMTKTLCNYGITKKFKIIGCEDWVKILHFFKQAKNYKKGDLVVYWKKTVLPEYKVAHLGLLDNPGPEAMWIESKWGTIKAIFKHGLFHLPEIWGTSVTIMRLQKAYRSNGPEQEDLKQYITNIMEESLENQQILKYLKLRVLQSANCGDEKKWKKTLMDMVQDLEQFASISVNEREEDGMHRTLLMLAVHHNNINLVSILISYGANKNLKDLLGKTVLDYAKYSNNKEIQALLS